MKQNALAAKEGKQARDAVMISVFENDNSSGGFQQGGQQQGGFNQQGQQGGFNQAPQQGGMQQAPQGKW